MWVQARLWDFNPPVGPVFKRKSTGLSDLVHKNEPDEWWGKAGRGDFQTHKYRLWCFSQPPAWSWVVHYILRRSILHVYFATCVWLWQAILRTEKERGKGTRSEISWPVNYELVNLNIKITAFCILIPCPTYIFENNPGKVHNMSAQHHSSRCPLKTSV